MKPLAYTILGLTLLAWLAAPDQTVQAGGDKGKLPPDSRLGKAKTLNDYFPFTPPKTKAEWEKRAQVVKEQMLVANGLWPMPHKTPLNPVVHGKIQRDGYTVEKVYFESFPGFYVTGNLYRPTEIKKGAKVPGVLCPHGHWANGRFYQANDASIKADLKSGGEKTAEGAKYPLQARCANLAMMGCVVFFYDMIGYADSKQIPHREGFKDAEASLRLQSFLGLQTWDSIRALDFLLSLPEVDAGRIGVTGASGGGTQTFVLCAVDERPTAAFPAVMVSTAMQGGCVCENCEYLRVGTGNIELAGLFAPKPLAMSAANDWTKDIETKGLPELKALYKLYGAEGNVEAKAWLEFGHNYNQVAREMMYNWFNKHLKLGQPSPVVERKFVPVPPAELSVFDDQHQLPANAKTAQSLRNYLTKEQQQQAQGVFPLDSSQFKLMSMVNGTALRAMMNDGLPAPDAVELIVKGKDGANEDGLKWSTGSLTRKGHGEQVPFKLLTPNQFNGSLVVWVHPDGIASLHKGTALATAAQNILSKGSAILAVDAFWTGDLQGTVIGIKTDAKKLKDNGLTVAKVQAAVAKAQLGGTNVGNLQFLFAKQDATKLIDRFAAIVVEEVKGKAITVANVAHVDEMANLPVDENYGGFTFGYNRTVLANRVHDILTAVAFARKQTGVKAVHLAGFGKAGPWVALAGPLCGDAVQKVAADMNQFRFEHILSMQEEMMQPGALKYGGLPALTALNAPRPLYLHNLQGVDPDGWIAAAYEATAQPKNLQQHTKKANMEEVVSWLGQ